MYVDFVDKTSKQKILIKIYVWIKKMCGQILFIEECLLKSRHWLKYTAHSDINMLFPLSFYLGITTKSSSKNSRFNK